MHARAVEAAPAHLTSAHATLTLWEALTSTVPAARGAVVLTARGTVADVASACDAPLAASAAAALDELRERSGPTLATVLGCPTCGQVLDVPLDLRALADSAQSAHDESDPLERRVACASGEVVVRAPTTSDVLDAITSSDPARHLRERCETWPPGAGTTDDDLAQVARAADDLTGLAAATVRASCPGCGQDVTADVDVVDLLTDQVTEQARTLLADVAELAAAYGWSQDAVLAMTPVRRRAYLDLVRAEW
ncbi:hypothetical protein [Cellulomonas sp. Leaf334]|uniref:hypothetical protein n=1 Tax=Cellulomonas sp. Leaf334 TaxID=1736339 RepID=UPI0006F6B796|nr:hypothetical protein [Cellulomonas sp. Leaf334]KQR15992.1 hypothetical protein ASF78_00660 [Cellulomonas sp. Leaf334]